MKLYLIRDISDKDSLFTVLDDCGDEKFYVSGSRIMSIIYDLEGNAVSKIRQLPLPAIRAYSITTGKRNFKFIINNSPNASNCYFYGVSWHIRGDVFRKSFDIIDADNSVVATHRELFTDKKKGYELDIKDDFNELKCVCAAVCVDLEARVDSRIMLKV